MQEPDLGVILQRVSSHVAGLAEMVNWAEHAIGDRLDLSREDAGVIGQLQSLDYLRQSLEDLTALTAAIGCQPGVNTIGVAGLADACSSLRLADTRALFQAQHCQGAAPLPTRSPGDLDLF
ncbi:hypothetical protein ACFQFQ_10265 [Sulfitobacter porphyrae]|jgi:hypothetical protein|uniref:Chemotaxis protein n=1 Tax=Sulfitobacter porphyrae TaxID=1246864 RepID=A0ABW2B3J7_9RHOB|nr:hypothetical protein GCM10007928_24790 [Sulfitobacter porphyrae]